LKLYFQSMQVIQTISELNAALQTLRIASRTIGLVPTMGALHNGHLSLVSASQRENHVTVASIFVNPTQFNNKEDLKKYPRTPESDLKKLNQSGVDIVFMPLEKEMYPEPDTRTFNFGNLDIVMEGKHRPGHFNGVAQIVSKFFSIVQPDKAYFGEKDFQQLAIIKQLVKQLNLSVKIVPCSIVREPDGLAMSSRNVLLTPAQRKSAILISKTLFESQKIFKNFDPEALKDWVKSTINMNADLSVEYYEIVDDVELMPVHSWDELNNKVGCIAVNVGKIRLIDNIRYN
jgi:pantoate--beta-alanine ligase